MKTFGQRIKEARKEKGLTLEQIGKACRSHKGYISGIENGKVKPPAPKILARLCQKLGLPIDKMAALACWEKRPKAVTVDAMLEILQGQICVSVAVEPPPPPADPAPIKEAV